MFARAAVCFLLLTLASAAFAAEANRVALVIGNSAYQRKALANPVNDARIMAEKLRTQGFEVFASYDAGQREMKRAIQSFAADLRERGKDVVAFIFYAGHGVQVKGENYLIPVDEHIASEADVDIDAVSLSSIMSMLENTQTRLAIVVLDACRDNPFAYARGGQRGLARMDAPSGSLVAFSTSPGKAAPDGPAGGNSYYTAALAQTMAEPGLKIEEVFKKVRVAVREKTRGEQTPWESTSLTGDFYPAGQKALESPLDSPVSANPSTIPGAGNSICTPLKQRQPFMLGQRFLIISKETFSVSDNVQRRLKSLYGETAELADWVELKQVLTTDQAISDFIKSMDLPLQADTSGLPHACGNLLVRSGRESRLGNLFLFIARHDGRVPNNWAVVDTIGNHAIDLGRWNYSSQALVAVPAGRSILPKMIQ